MGVDGFGCSLSAREIRRAPFCSQRGFMMHVRVFLRINPQFRCDESDELDSVRDGAGGDGRASTRCSGGKWE